MKITVLFFAWLLASTAAGWCVEPPRPVLPEVFHPHLPGDHQLSGDHQRVCFSAAETREKITSRRLVEPFRLLRSATGRTQGEFLRAKLCRWDDDFVYEIALLRRDGRIVRVYLNATNGQTVSAAHDR